MTSKEIFLSCIPKDKWLVNCRYGKTSDKLYYEIGTHKNYSYGSRSVRVTIINKETGKTDFWKVFEDEQEETGGRIIGKYYKDASVLANEYIKELKEVYK